MTFRFTLSHETLGSQEISAPDGWKDAVLKLERDTNFHSLVEYFNGSFIFYGDNGEVNGGIDFIREVESQYGFDADLSITIEISPDGFSYEDVFIGLLKLDAIQEMEDNRMQVPIVRNDFWNKFINRLETPVNLQSELSLDDDVINDYDSININLTPQKLPQSYTSVLETSTILSDTSWTGSGVVPTRTITSQFDDDWVQFSFDPILDEIDDVFTIPIALNDVLPVENLYAIYGGTYVIEAKIICGIIVGAELFSPSRVYATGVHEIPDRNDLDFFYQVNDQPAVPFQVLNVGYSLSGKPGSQVSEFVLSPTTLELEAGDVVRIFGKFTGEFTFSSISANDGIGLVIYGEDVTEISVNNMGGTLVDDTTFLGVPINDTTASFVNITAQTVFPETNGFGFLLHDAGGQVVDRIVSRNNSFYSEFLGSGNTIYRQYDQDGCGWKYSLLKGLQLRRYSLVEKPFFMSFKSWWDGANPILNLGLGYEEMDGYEVIRVEEKAHFYDPEVSLNISNVRDIRRSYDTGKIFKTVRIGYRQWQSENTSGIDDPQTKHTYASRIQKTGTDLTLESEFIAASLAIETTRRTTREKSADYKFDNEVFIIAIDPTPIFVSPETSPNVTDFRPELDENFTSITNLLNSETRYNSRLTPARNLIRWLNYLSGCLQSYLGSTFKFTAGEGNYAMESDMSNVSDGCDEFKLPLSESQNIPVADYYLHLPIAYEISIPMEWEDYKTIRENRKKAIGISQTGENHTAFFIKELEYKIFESTAVITAWPIEFFDIQVVEYVPALVQCQESDILLLTVDNTNITVDSEEYTVDQTQYTI